MPAPVALSKPTETERGKWYFQRYVEHLPSAGNMVVLDRSWYNRAGVERVLGFCTETEATKFLEEAPLFEAGLVRDGIMADRRPRDAAQTRPLLGAIIH